MKKILTRRFLPVFLTALLCLQFMMPVAGAVTQADIDDLKEQQTNLNAEKNEIKQKLSSLGDDKDKALE